MSDLLEVIGTHCTSGGADKVWGSALLRDSDGKVTMLTVWGRRGNALQTKTEIFGDEAGARKQYTAKVKEKVTKAYDQVDLAKSGTGILDALAGLDPQVRGSSGGATMLSIGGTGNGAIAAAGKPRVVVSHVSVLKAEDLAQRLADPDWGMTEKVNGNRSTLELTADGRLIAYNRRGQVASAVPEAAQALAGRGSNLKPMLLDGEWLPGGEYAIFDLLEYDGVNVRPDIFHRRMARLESALDGIVRAGPSLMRNHPITAGLYLLKPTVDARDKRTVYTEIQDGGGEGVIFRLMTGASVAGNTRFELKVKFQAELDAIVVGGKSGRAGGSVILGLLRRDGAIIEIGAVRSGLNDSNVSALVDATRGVSNANLPVIRVQFLAARTVGISLVEPKAGPNDIRQDKVAAECMADQLVDLLGDDRQALIDAAPVYR